MKLEVGKRYRDNAGLECVVLSDDGSSRDNFLVNHAGGGVIWHSEDGKANIGWQCDLVEEINPAAKFKVGDRVRIIHTDYTNVGLDVGGVHNIVCVGSNVVSMIGSDGEKWNFYFHELEPAPTTRFKVGETYTVKRGDNYKCINVNEDGSAHLAFDARTPAYVWDADGRSVSLSSEWDIVFQPVVETKHHVVTVEGNLLTIVYKVIDGKPDTDNAQLVPF